MVTKLISLVVFAAAFCACCGAAHAQSPSSSTRDLAFNCYNNSFYVGNNGSAYYADSTGGGQNPNFWQNAEMIEVAEDAYDRAPSSGTAAMITALCNGFLSRYSSNWTGNSYNDDILWASIAFVRAKMDTGNDTFGQIAASNFNAVWNRAWDTSLGGGLWWTTAKTGKNACVNGPGMIAATLFYAVNYGSNYLTQAKAIYNWERSHIVDTTNGHVADHMNSDGSIDWSMYTYNQGTWIGGNALLFHYAGGGTYSNDGKLAIVSTQQNLTGQHVSGIFNDEYGGSGGDGDGPGFKGIFARWTCKWVAYTGDTEFNTWLRQNANAAWQYRNSSGVTWAMWWQRTSNTSITAWECSSACVILQDCP